MHLKRTVLTLFDGLGFLLVVAVLFFPSLWFVGYFIWEGMKLRNQMNVSAASSPVVSRPAEISQASPLSDKKIPPKAA